MGDAEVRIKIRVDAGDAKTALGETARQSDGVRDSFDAIGRLAEAAFWVGLARKVEAIGRHMLDLAADADDSARAMRTLGGAFDAVSQSTNDTVDELDVLRTQQELVAAGFRVTSDEMATLARTARERGINTLQATSDVMEQLSGAFISGSERALRPFGDAIVHTANRADTFHRSLARLHEQQQHTAPSARTLREEMDSLSREFHDAEGAISLVIARGLGLTNVFHQIASAASEVTDALRTMPLEQASNERNENHDDLVQGTLTMVQRLQRSNQTNQGLSTIGRLFGSNRAGVITMQQLQQLHEASVRAYTTGSDADLQALDTLAEQIDRASAHQTQPWEMAANPNNAAAVAGRQTEAADLSQNTSSGGGGSDIFDRLTAIKNRQNDIDAKHLSALSDEAAILDSMKDKADRLRTALQQETMEQVQGANAKANESDQASANEQYGDMGAALANQGNGRGKAGSFDKTGGMADAARAAGSFDAQFSQAFAHNADLTQTKAQEMAGSVVDAYGSMKSAFMEHLDAVVQGKETIGQALASMTRQILLHIGEEAAWKAILNLGEGIAALARGVASYGSDGGAVASAPQFFAAAAIYGGIAAATIGGGLAINPGSSGGGGMASYAGAGSSGGSASYGGGGGHGGGGSHVIDTSSNSRPTFGGSTAGTGGGNVNIFVNVQGVMANDQTADVVGRTIENLRDRDRLPTIPQWGG